MVGALALRNGTPVVDIVDKSGSGPAPLMAGNLATGLARAIADVTTGKWEDLRSVHWYPDCGTISQYRVPNWIGDVKEHLYVVYRDGEVTGTSRPSSRGYRGRVLITAWSSMPGVTELLRVVNGVADP